MADKKTEDPIEADKVEAAATGVGVAISKALGKIPFVASFQNAMIGLGGKNASKDIQAKRRKGPRK